MPSTTCPCGAPTPPPRRPVRSPPAYVLRLSPSPRSCLKDFSALKPESPDRSPVPQVLNAPWGNFFKNLVPEKSEVPPPYGTQAQKFQTDFQPDVKPEGHAPGQAGKHPKLRHRDVITNEPDAFYGGLRLHEGGRCKGEGGTGRRGRPGEGRATPCRFLDTLYSGVSTVRSRTSGLGLRRKPDTSGGTPSSRVIMISPKNFRFFGRIPNSSSICKGSYIRTIWKN